MKRHSNRQLRSAFSSHAGTAPIMTVLAIGLIACVGCGKQKAASKPPLRPVRTSRLALSKPSAQRTFSGRAQATATANLSFKVNGQLSVLKVKVGDTVKKGQLIAVVDDRDYRLQLRKAQAAYAQARAQQRNARASYQRTRKLYENRSVSVQDLDTARAAADSARASLAAQGQAVAVAKRQLGYCKLRAPATGQIASVPVNLNENIKAGQPIATLNSGRRAEVNFTVPESLIGRVKKGASCTIRFAALPKKKYPATITEVGVAAAGGTAFSVVAQLTAAHAEIRAGMAAEVALALAGKAKHEAKIYVPVHTVMEDEKGRFVFLAKGKTGSVGVVERRAVKTGRLTARGLEINAGLKADDRLITAGLRFVEPGLKVRILAD
jgi:multidrug efflux system membrane fusion protein